jgi:hypothetical protein
MLRGLRPAVPSGGGEGRGGEEETRCGGAMVSPVALAGSVVGAKGFFLMGSTPENLRFLVYEAYFTASLSPNHRRSFRNPAKFLNVALILVKFPSISGMPHYIQLIFRRKKITDFLSLGVLVTQPNASIALF